MKSFRWQLTKTLVLSFLVINSIILTAYTINNFHAVIHNDKRKMKNISKSIIDELPTHFTAKKLPQSLIQSINSHFKFLNKDKRMAYAIGRNTNEIIYYSPNFKKPLENKYLFNKSHSKVFLRKVKSGEEIGDWFSEWHFLLRYTSDNGYVIFVTNRSYFELIERFFESFLIAFFLSLILALLIGWKLSKKMVSPLENIHKTLIEIRKGKFSARVKINTSSEEIMDLTDNLNNTFQDLQSAFSKIQCFANDVAHELNTPLTAMHGNIEIALSKQRTNEEYISILEKNDHQITRLTKTVKDILLMASPKSKIENNFEKVNLSETLNEVIESLCVFAEKKQLKIYSNIEKGLAIQGVSSLLFRLFYNLYHNAIKFSQDGKSIKISLKKDSNNIKFSIDDNGIGMEEEKIKDIFNYFYQIDPSRHDQGTGLGLTLVKWISQSHNADISVKSAPDKGTFFSVSLPLSKI
ncbi:MAG: HAMP domain-containing sensor histidine kinase [Verrucomicrobiota bacterium]|nr:HAMP domain-containing sensor histidine kinase [Verrucomicrobiota bacterium]